MNIALAAGGDTLTAAVSDQFELCRHLLIVNFETKECIALANSPEAEDIMGERLAKAVLEHDCEAVITGLIRPVAFEILAGKGVTRFKGVGYDGREALELMDANKLELIREANGGEGCGGSHHH